MLEIILFFILCVFIYIVGKENGKKETTKLIKKYWNDSKDINEFWRKFTMLWNEYVGEEKENGHSSSRWR